MRNVSFGVAEQSSGIAIGVMGVGPSADGYSATRIPSYPSIIGDMASQGLINSRAFSLSLRDYDGPTGAYQSTYLRRYLAA